MGAKEANLITSVSSIHESGYQRSDEEKNMPYKEKGNESISETSLDPALGPDTLARGLKSRHLSLIALGGSIGTGLFLGSGLILATCGPASFLIAFIIMSFVVYNVM